MAYYRPHARLGLAKLGQMAENISYGNKRDGRDFEWAPAKHNYVISLPNPYARRV